MVWDIFYFPYWMSHKRWVQGFWTLGRIISLAKPNYFQYGILFHFPSSNDLMTVKLVKKKKRSDLRLFSD
jgi:hypothetical protein